MYKIKVLEKNERGKVVVSSSQKNNEHERFDSTLDRLSPTLPEFSVSIIVYRRFQKNQVVFLERKPLLKRKIIMYYYLFFLLFVVLSR